MMTGIVTIAAATAAAEPVAYTLESGHTYPSFEVSHMGLSMWRGKFNKTAGKVWLDRQAKAGRMDVTIDTRTVNFGLAVMDQRAQNEDWFDTASYPTATYKADSMTFNGDVPAVVNGLLTIRGITKPVKMDIVRFKCMMHPMLKREVCGGSARAEFDRREYGMTHDIFDNDGSVRLQIEFEAFRGETLPDFTKPPPGGFPAGGPPPGPPPGAAGTAAPR
jgi:polyisoprenoid-binding protein YceI